jgi:hypothetical protein
MKKLLCVLLLCASAFADIHFSAVQPTTTVFLGRQWGSMNQTWIFSPLYPATTMFLYIRNNSSNSKNFTITLYSTPNASIADRTNNTGAWTTLQVNPSTGCPTTAATNTTVNCYVVSVYSAQIAFQISGATTGGTTDTADVFIAQSPFPPFGPLGGQVLQVMGPTPDNTIFPTAYGNPVMVGGLRIQNPVVIEAAGIDQTSRGWMIGSLSGGGGDSSQSGQMVGPSAGSGATVTYLATIPFVTPNDSATLNAYRMRGAFEGVLVQDPLHFAAGTNAINNIEAKVAGYIQRDVVNPAAAADMLNITVSGANMFHIAKITIDCTVVCDVILNKISTVGVTCTALTISRISSNLTGMSTTAATRDCVTIPTVDTQVFHWHLAANDNKVFDVSEFWEGAAANRGFSLINGAAIAAGTVSFTVEFFER